MWCAACGDNIHPPDATPPSDTPSDVPVDAPLDAPVDAAPCTDGAMRCNGTGFDTCSEGAWVYRECGPGTSCVPTGTTILCDFI